MALMNIKSKYILKQIFNHINLNIFLNIIRYNKLFQQKLNIDISDYKLNSKIIIEIESNSNYGYINLEDENINHLYNDDNKIKIEKDYKKGNEKIKYIKIIIDRDIKTVKELFSLLFFTKNENYIL